MKFVSITRFKIKVEKKKMRIPIAVKSTNRIIKAVKIKSFTFSVLGFSEYSATNLTTDVDIPRLAKLAIDVVDNTTDQTPRISTPSLFIKNLYRKK